MQLLLIPPMIRPPRPLGIVILAVLQILSGIGDVFIAVLLLFAFIFLGGVKGGVPADALLFLGILALILGAFSFVLAYGLWTGKGWAWGLSIIGAVIGLALGLLWLVVSGLTPQSLTSLVPIILSAIILIYLNTSGVRAFFGKLGGVPVLVPMPPPVPAQPYPPLPQPPYQQPTIQQPYYPQPYPTPSAQPSPWGVTVCPNCGTPPQPAAYFCDRCGTRLR